MLAADVEQEFLLLVGELAAASAIGARLGAERIESAFLECVVPALECRDRVRPAAV